MTTKLNWNRDTAAYANGQLGRLGPFIVAHIYWDGCVSKGDPNPYKATCLLPGCKTNLGHYASADLAKANAEALVTYWLNQLPAGLLK